MGINNKIKSAFDQVYADDSLKTKTKTYIYEKTGGFEKKFFSKSKRLAVTMAGIFAVIVAIGGYFSCSVPISAVSIDINPSIEMELNIFDRVVNIKGYNDDAAEIISELDIENLYYSDAINTILENDEVVSLLESDNHIEVTATSRLKNKSSTIQNCIASQTHINANDIYCLDNQEDINMAHAAGLSFGKYRAFLELKEIDPNITVDDIRNLSMREIRNRIDNSNSSDTVNNKHGKHYGNNQNKSANRNK